MRTVSQAWKLAAASGAQRVLRIRFAPTGWTNVATTGIDVYSGDKYDPIWGGYSPQVGIIDSDEISRRIDVITLEASIGGYNFYIQKNIWNAISALYLPKGMNLSVSLGFPGVSTFVNLWLGIVREASTEGNSVYVECDAALEKLNTSMDYSEYNHAHPLYLIKEIMTEKLETAEFDAASFNFTSYGDIAHFVVGRNYIGLSGGIAYDSGDRVNAITVDGNNFANGIMTNVLDEVMHLAQLMLGTIILSDGVYVFKKYDPSPTVVGVLTEEQCNFTHRSSYEYIRNYMSFKFVRGNTQRSVDNAFIGYEIIDATNGGQYPQSELNFESDWVNGVGFIYGAQKYDVNGYSNDPADWEYAIGGRLGDQTDHSGGDIILLMTKRHHKYPNFWPGKFAQPGYFSGYCGLGQVKGLGAPTQLSFNSLSLTYPRYAYLRLFDATTFQAANTEVISIDIWSGDPNDTGLFLCDGTRFSSTTLGQPIANPYSLSPGPTMSLITGSNNQNGIVAGRIEARGLYDTFGIDWGLSTFTGQPGFVDATIPLWWLDTNVERLRNGVPILLGECPLNTIEYELFDAVNILTNNFSYYQRAGTDPDDKWVIFEESFNPLSGPINRTFGMLTAGVFSDPPGFTITHRPGNTLPNPIDVEGIDPGSSTVQVSQGSLMSADASGQFIMSQLSDYTEQNGTIKAEISVYEDDTSNIQAIIQSSFSVDASGVVTILSADADQVIFQKSNGYTTPILKFVVDSANEKVMLDYSNLNAVLTGWTYKLTISTAR